MYENYKISNPTFSLGKATCSRFPSLIRIGSPIPSEIQLHISDISTSTFFFCYKK